MNYKEALNEVKELCCWCECKVDDMTKIAIVEALEKQIPKEPIAKNTEKPCLYCPTCGVELFVENHHCKCGQALDWSESK